jgi:hypothetical protein
MLGGFQLDGAKKTDYGNSLPSSMAKGLARKPTCARRVDKSPWGRYEQCCPMHSLIPFRCRIIAEDQSTAKQSLGDREANCARIDSRILKVYVI